MRNLKFFLLLFFIIVVNACSTHQKAYLKNDAYSKHQDLPVSGLLHTAYLIGDAGGLDDYDTNTNVVFEAVAQQLHPDKKNQSIIFLGDNIYPDGLRKKEYADRSREEKILDAHIELGKKNPGETYIIPGNHDWNDGRKGGRKSILRQYEYVKDIDKSYDINFFPKKGCGDPEVVKINKNLVFIFIDSQWWLHRWDDEKKMNKGCELKTRRAFADKIQNLFTEYKNDQIVVFLHHPFKTNGNHGGKFSFKEHIFPLTNLNKNAYLPLPILGSIPPVLIKLGISRQDNSHQLYQDLHNIFLQAIRTAKSHRVIFASGHEHSLQHFQPEILLSKDNLNYLVSGSGYKTNYARKGAGADFVAAKRGYHVIRFYDDQSAWLDIISVDKKTKKTTLEYRRKIAKTIPKSDANFDYLSSDIAGDTTTILNPSYKAGAIKKTFLGEQYRDLWINPVNAPFVDVEKIEGGLIPTKLGGGQSSNSLRLERADGRQYILRSVNKDYYKLFPKQYKQLVWIKVYADQNASAIPYGALMIPRLSDAAGVYHTNPRLFYLKKQKGLLQYNNLLNEGLYLFEKRPSGKGWKDDYTFGYAENIIGFNDLIDNLENKTNHFVDQKWVLKSRLFDWWIHDWDRHDDQWRWAVFKNDGKTIYRPIPRDRDWAFFKYEGLVYRYFSTFYQRKFRTFEKKIKDIVGLTTSAAHFDRHFMNELVWEDWERAVDSMQQKLNPTIISQAINDLPEEAIPFVKEELQTKLEQRLKDLKKYARAYYKILYKEVSVVGTNEEDIFEIEYLEGGRILVQMFRDSKKYGKVLRYKRVFNPSITKEIRLYGLADSDVFNFRGTASKKI
ncbi:MAG: metallophosphoesterase, partial [Bacteroidota bacterium]